MKMNPLVTSLSLYDIVNTPGVAADLSHINTNSTVAGYKGDDLEKVRFASCFVFFQRILI